MTSRRKTAAICAVLFGVVAAALWGIKAFNAKPKYALGIIANFKGKNAQLGGESLNSFNLAYAQYQKSHPDGYELEILPVDDSWDKEKIRSAYLSIADKADLLICLTSSTNILLVLDDIRARPQLVHALIGPATTRISGLQDNIVRSISDVEQEQRQIAEFISGKGFKKVLLAVENEYNPQYTAEAVKCLRKYATGLELDEIGFSGNKMDTEAIQNALRRQNYDAMYAVVGGMPREDGILIQHARAMQKDIPVIITPWIRGLIFLQSLGKECANIYMPCHLKMQDNQAYSGFMQDYEQKYGVATNEYFSPICFDFANTLMAALEKSGSPKADALMPMLLAEEYNGTTGTLKFDKYGDALTEIHFYQLVNGQWQYLPNHANGKQAAPSN